MTQFLTWQLGDIAQKRAGSLSRPPHDKEFKHSPSTTKRDLRDWRYQKDSRWRRWPRRSARQRPTCSSFVRSTWWQLVGVLSSQNFANIINIVLSSVNHIATSNYWDVHGCTSAAFVPTVCNPIFWIHMGQDVIVCLFIQSDFVWFATTSANHFFSCALGFSFDSISRFFSMFSNCELHSHVDCNSWFDTCQLPGVRLIAKIQ